MDFKFTVKLDEKLHKGAVHYPTPAAVTLALKNIFYRHYKTDNISLPYLGKEQLDGFIASGYIDLVGVIIDGELMDSIRVNLNNGKEKL